MMSTATSIHPSTTPPAQPVFQGIEGTDRGFRTPPLKRTRDNASPVGDLGGFLSRWSPERERPEDDEAVITAVLATVTHRSSRERPEDDEVIPTYTSEPACRPTRSSSGSDTAVGRATLLFTTLPGT
jgi:hypothetical protein